MARGCGLVSTVGVMSALFTGSLYAQESDAVRLTILVVNAESGTVLPGTVIQLSGIGERFLTDERGTLSIYARLGEYRLTARKNGYRVLEGDLEVKRAGDFTLELDPLSLADPSTLGRLSGTLADHGTGRPIEGALVELLGLGQRLTDRQGYFLFEDVPTGPFRVETRMVGYADRTESVTIQQGQTTVLRIGMAVDPIELEPIDVEVRSRFLEEMGVYERMTRGSSGHIVARLEIEQRRSQHLSDSFYAIPGLRVRRNGRRTILVGRGDCPLDVFLDGIPVASEENDGLYDIDQIPPGWVELAEVYAGAAATPVEYGLPGRHCGVVLIWTRRGRS
jgi:carboxypeptidase family protein/TonB-dependent receptor-like protein